MMSSASSKSDEVSKWQTRAELYEREYHVALKRNQEIAGAVGHMTQAASEREGDMSNIQYQVVGYQRELQQKESQIKQAELEKEDITKQEEERMAARLLNDAEIAKSKRDFELKK